MKAAGSRLLARLEAARAAARDPIEQACLRAEHAGYRARQGRGDEARAELRALHTQFDRQPHPAVSVWLCLVEGWVAHDGSADARVHDRFKRAHALSMAAGLTRLQALSAAWLAHLDHAHRQMDAMARHTIEALHLAEPADHAARARACLVAAQAYEFAERSDLAQPWSGRAREQAQLDGDDQTLGTLIHGMAWHSVHHALQTVVFGGDAREPARQALARVEAAENFDALAGGGTLRARLPLLRALIASAQGDFAAALAQYARCEPDRADAQRGPLAANVLADRAWCRWQAGDTSAAALDADAALAHIDDAALPDDARALGHARLAQVLGSMGQVEAGEKQRRLADA
ncbi:MAG: hypothetical protein ABIP61_05915, partial [Burkholderiaceae bacterium]